MDTNRKYSSLAEAFADPDLYCTCVAAMLTDNFETEWLDWEPETLEIELRQLGVNVNNNVMDRAMACSTLLGTNLFHTSFEAWNNLVQVLNQNQGQSELFTPADLDDAMWGCAEARLLEGPEIFDGEPFSGNTRLYIGTLLSKAGITKAPSILSFALFDDAEILRRDEALTSDEFIFKAYWDRHQDTVNLLENMAIEKSRELFRQFLRLPLKNADSEYLKRLSEASHENKGQAA